MIDFSDYSNAEIKTRGEILDACGDASWLAVSYGPCLMASEAVVLLQEMTG